MSDDLISKLKYLGERIESLYLAAEDKLPQMKDTLSGEGGVPQGFPSKESFAELIFRDIDTKLRYVNEAVKEIKATLPNR